MSWLWGKGCELLSLSHVGPQEGGEEPPAVAGCRIIGRKMSFTHIRLKRGKENLTPTYSPEVVW